MHLGVKYSCKNYNILAKFDFSLFTANVQSVFVHLMEGSHLLCADSKDIFFDEDENQ